MKYFNLNLEPLKSKIFGVPKVTSESICFFRKINGFSVILFEDFGFYVAKFRWCGNTGPKTVWKQKFYRPFERKFYLCNQAF